MKLSLNWINDFVNLKNVSQEQLLEKLNTSICEIDDIYSYQPQNQTIIAVKINSIAKHSVTDRLRICQTTDGKTIHQIITNAENVQEGNTVPLALPGTTLDGKEITKAMLGGIESNGMFCSEKELGLADKSHGVLILDENVKLGTSMQEYFDLEDTILDIDNKSITHRPDLWSHFGFARELAAQFKLKIKFNPFDTQFTNFSPKLKKTIVNTNSNAYAYFACHITDVKVKPSNLKFRTRLQKCGIRSINNIVDVSNYVMLEMGQPTHFFDKNKLGEVSLEVSYSKEGEKIPLLNDSIAKLQKEILLIRNSDKPVAIAGIMGGSETAVDNETTELIIESATFKREDIRKGIKLTGIRSDASVRYEKGLDSYSTLPVIHRSLQLLSENGCPDLLVSSPAGFNHTKTKKVVIQTDISFINRKLGEKLKTAEIISTLNRLNFVVVATGEKLKITAPWFRHNYDITIPEDIVEEIGRTIGYAKIKPDHLISEVRPPIKNVTRELEKKLKIFFSSNMHFNEVYNYSFCSENDLSFENDEIDGIKVQNEMPIEFSHLRTTIYPSLLKNLDVNADRFESIRIFEIGRTYHKSIKKTLKNTIELPTEKRWLGFTVIPTAKANDNQGNETEFIELRSQIKSLLESLGLNKELVCRTQPVSYFHPSCSVSIAHNDKDIIELGIIHPAKLEHFNLKKRVFAGKIFFDNLLEVHLTSMQQFDYKIPSIYPQDKIDISIILQETDRTELFANLVKRAKIKEVEKIWVHDVYRGEKLGEGKKSVTYRLALMNYEETFSAIKIKEITDKLFELAKGNHFQIR